MEAMLGVFARHALTAVGALAVTKGYVDADTVSAVAGAVSTLVGVAWSFVQKKRSGAM